MSEPNLTPGMKEKLRGIVMDKFKLAMGNALYHEAAENKWDHEQAKRDAEGYRELYLELFK